MAKSRQPAATGKVMYRIGPDGRLSSVDAEAAQSEAVEVTQRIVTAQLINGELTVEVGATATIGGERIVNRTVNLSEDLADDELTAGVRDVLERIQAAAGDALDAAVTEDARADVAFASNQEGRE